MWVCLEGLFGWFAKELEQAKKKKKKKKKRKIMIVGQKIIKGFEFSITRSIVKTRGDEKETSQKKTTLHQRGCGCST